MYICICLICHKNSVKETEKFSDSSYKSAFMMQSFAELHAWICLNLNKRLLFK